MKEFSIQRDINCSDSLDLIMVLIKIMMPAFWNYRFVIDMIAG